MKTCTKCRETRPESQFQKATRSADGLQSWCRLCMNKYSKARRTPAGQKEYKLKLKYGITQDQYDQMLKDQNGTCAICGQPETIVDTKTNKIINLAVDHCHTTGKIRGLLCSTCNHMLGNAKENPQTLLAAIEYLDNYSD